MYPLRQMMRDAAGTNPRMALAGVRALTKETDWLLVRAVRLARAEGYDWARIGRLLGVSRQAARKRFEHLDGAVGPVTPFTPPHVRRSTPLERQAQSMAEAKANLRRRREFDAGDAVFW
ncbi:MAG: hypothetical protein Q8M22_15370 [Actinomycetota bacterium]|nr:hypothetical protein [Actinomycetota bacterium]